MAAVGVTPDEDQLITIPIPDFKTEAQRQQWFIENAQYWTTVTRRAGRKVRTEYLTRAEAKAHAHKMLKDDLTGRPYMIYAVVGRSDSFVENVMRQEDT